MYICIHAQAVVKTVKFRENPTAKELATSGNSIGGQVKVCEFSQDLGIFDNFTGTALNVAASWVGDVTTQINDNQDPKPQTLNPKPVPGEPHGEGARGKNILIV